MKLLRRPTISELWATTSRLPMGKRIFSRLVGRLARYTGTIGANVLEMADGHARIELRDRALVRNHLDSIHAVALMNLGEMTTGLSVLHAIDGRGRGIVTSLRMDYLKKARGTITATCDVKFPTEPGQYHLDDGELRRDGDGEKVPSAATLPTRPGKYDLEVEGELVDAGGDAVARVWALWKIELGTPERASSGEAVTAAGSRAGELPPKTIG